jgi:hypothetical protein
MLLSTPPEVCFSRYKKELLPSIPNAAKKSKRGNPSFQPGMPLRFLLTIPKKSKLIAAE